MSSISGLTEKQQKQIQEMEFKHSEAMDELRTKRLISSNAIEISELRTEMLKKVDAHRKSVKAILTDDQQKQFEQLHRLGNFGQQQKFAGQQGTRNFRGRGNACNSTLNFRGERGNLPNAYGNGKRANYTNCRNGLQERKINYGQGKNRTNCTVSNS